MQVDIRTTQNVSIHYPVASVGDRILAYIVDSLIIFLFVILVIVLFLNVAPNVTNDDSFVWIMLVLVFIPILFYHLLFEIFMNGQSPGKRAMSIQVVKLNGTQPSIGDYISTLR